MTDLAHKFATFEEQLNTQHIALMGALANISYALGAPPETPLTSLDDVITAITATNTALTGVNNKLTSIDNQIGSFRSEVNPELENIYTQLQSMLANDSTNVARLIAVLLTTACACNTDVPFIGPPLDVTPTDLAGQDKCRRIQYYLSIFGAMIDGIANYGGAGAMVTSAAITEILYASVVAGGLVGGEVGAVGGPPGIVAGAIVGIIGALIGALGSSYLFTMSAQWHQSPLPDELLAALYAADSADAGANAFYAVVNASEVLNGPFKPLINALFWNGWANDIYGATPVVDDSAFDGTICAPEIVFPPTVGCVTLNSVVTHLSNGQDVHAIEWPDGTDTSPASESGAGADLTADHNIFGHAELLGYWIYSVPDSHCYYNANGIPNFNLPSTPAQFTTNGNYYAILSPDHVFSITICVDEPG